MKRIFLTCSIALLTSAALHADVVLSDSFSYANGPLTDAAGSPWIAHSGIGNGPLSVTNGQAWVSFNNAEDINAPLMGAPYDTTNNPAVTALYYSFKIKVATLPSATGTYFAHFKDDGTFNFRCRLFALTSGAAAGTFHLGIAATNSASTTAGFAAYPQDLMTNTVYKVVARMSLLTGASTLWINPTAENDPSISSTSDPGTILPVTTFALRQASGEGVDSIDDLRVGTVFTDVAGLNNPPSISGVAKQNTAAGVATAPIPFTIGDQETAAESLTVSGTSSNPTLVMNGNIVFAGSGSNRTVTLTPEAGQQGTTTITLTVTDLDGGMSSTAFQLAVGVPTISDIPSQSTPVNTVLGPISFTVNDTESPANSLTVTATSSNQVLVADANIAIGGSGATRTITIIPTADQAGLTAITVTVSDGANSASDTFLLVVNPLLGVLRMDDFNRPNGPLVQLDGQWLSNGGTGLTNFQQMQIVGNKLQVTGTQSEDCSTELPPGEALTPTYPPSSGTIFYVSMRINYQVLPSAAGAYFAHFRDNSTGFRCRIYAATTGAAAGHYRIGIANSANVITAPALIATDLATNQSYFIVARYSVPTGESRLWLEPATESSPHVNAVDGAQPIIVEAFTFRQNSDIGTVCVDDLKIGTSFSDVVPVSYRLSIVASGDDVQISWPTAAVGYKLQSTGTLPASPWTDVLDVPEVQGENNVVRYMDVTGNRFFRLNFVP